MTYRHLVFVTLVVVVAAIVFFPARVLVNHYFTVNAMAAFPNDFELVFGEPYLGDRVKQRWFTRLFGTVTEVIIRKPVCSVEDAQSLHKLRGLTAVSLYSPSDEVWGCLPKNLVRLCVGSRYLTPYAHSRLAEMRRLRRLSVRANLSDQDVESLTRLAGIDELDLGWGNERLTDACLLDVAKMTSLKVFRIRLAPVRLSSRGLPLGRNLSANAIADLAHQRPDLRINP